MLVITWSNYVGVLIAVLGVYYGIVLLLYYRKKKKPVSQLRPSVSGKANVVRPVDKVLFPEDRKSDPAFDAANGAPVHSLVDELQAYVAQAGKEQEGREEVLSALQGIIQKYPHIPGSIFQSGINNLIEVIVENNCGFRLSADEISGLWQNG